MPAKMMFVVSSGLRRIDEVLHIDHVSRNLGTIDSAHHQIHEGNDFVCTDILNVSSATAKWMIEIDAVYKGVHMLFPLAATGEMQYVITEGADRDRGTVLSCINRRRTDSNPRVATTIISRTPTGGTTDGATTLLSGRVGSSTGATGTGAALTITRGESEFNMRSKTKYVVAITTFANIYVTFQANFYEYNEGLIPANHGL